jgi:hypothetical protein
MADLVLSGWNPQDYRRTHIGRQGLYNVGLSVANSTNAIYESLFGRAAPGASRATVMPHDHTEEGGGAIVPRGRIWGFDHGYKEDGWEYEFSSGHGGNTGIEQEMFPDRPDADFWVDPTSGINGSKTNLSGNPCTLVAGICMWSLNSSGALASFRFRLKNVETNAVSSWATMSMSAYDKRTKQLRILDVPLSPINGRQGFRVEVEGTESGIVRIFALSIYETREQSQPASEGSHLYDSVAGSSRP